jgi:hypothetical protein
VLDLAPAEHDGDLDLVAAAQEALDVAALGVEVVVADLGRSLISRTLTLTCFLRAALRACSFWYLNLP